MENETVRTQAMLAIGANAPVQINSISAPYPACIGGFSTRRWASEVDWHLSHVSKQIGPSVQFIPWNFTRVFYALSSLCASREGPHTAPEPSIALSRERVLDAVGEMLELIAAGTSVQAFQRGGEA